MSQARRALVTGASRGLGCDIARELASRGHEVLVNYRSNQGAADALVQEIVRAGGSAKALAFDVTERETCSKVLEAELDEAGPIEIVVNNAGLHVDTPFAGMEPEDWSKVIATNLDSFYNVTQPLIFAMMKKRWGRVINIGSVAGVVGNRGQVNYSAAKAGLHGATKALAQELGRRNITVNAVAPGLVETEMVDDMDPEHKARALEIVSLRRMAKPVEIAKVVGFLASEDASYISGQIINVNGGLAGA